MKYITVAAIGLLLTSVSAQVPVWKQTKQPTEKRVESLLKELTLDEKVNLCTMRSWMESSGVPRLGIGHIKLADGPQGITRHTQPTALPVGINLSCTWNPNSAQEYGQLIGEEMLGEKRHWILGPGVNLMRTPLNGRNFEYFGEDPFLAGTMATHYIHGVQSKGVAACIKHLIANNQENHRYVSSSNVDERTLRELYLVPFEMAVKSANVWGMMSAYNRINGVYASQHQWLQETLTKKEWGFDGVMVSDWLAVHLGDEKAAALGGLDLEMGSTIWTKDKALSNLVKSGSVPISVIDDKARRIIRFMIRTGVINPEDRPAGSVQTAAHQKIVRRLAAEGMVLLKNDNHNLPLDREKINNILVVGPNANTEHRGGGGSGGVMSPYEITPLKGIQSVLGDKVTYIAGLKFSPIDVVPANLLKTSSGKDGLTGEYFANTSLKGKSLFKAASAKIDMKWGKAMFGLPVHPKMPNNDFSVRFTGRFVSPITGKVKIGLASDDGSRLWFDNQLIVDMWEPQARRVKMAEVSLKKGTSYNLKIEYFDSGRDASLQLLWNDPAQGTSSAIAAAKHADAVIFIGGTNHSYDQEGGWGTNSHDIPNLELIGPQAQFISALAKVNANLTVVLVNGSVVNMEQWIDSVPSVLETWYGGQEAGNAIADILFGKINPSGKLSCTFGKKLNDYACHAKGLYPGKLGPLKEDPHTDYKEGLFIGYRWFDQQKITPRFPFGHGLSYTSFDVKNAEVAVVKNSLTDPQVSVKVAVTNTGGGDGSEVVQLYVRDQQSSVIRPNKELKAFKKVFIKAGETKIVTLNLNFRSLAFWSTKDKAWKIEAGSFDLIVATSASDIKSTHTITIK